MAKYFTLTNSNASFSRRFRVVADGYLGSYDKKQDIQTTVDGSLDISEGSIRRSWTFTLRVRETEEEDDYGTLADLIQFFKYNNPKGTPSNILTMVDHLSDTYNVIFVGKVQPKPFATQLIGTTAWYWVEVNFLSKDQELQSGSSGS